MKHHSKIRKLGRKRDQRKALYKTLMSSLVKYGKIETTEAKAKEIRPTTEKLVTKARTKTLANQRILFKHLSKEAARKMINEIGSRYENKKGGYTRIIKLGPRRGDAAARAIIEFV